MGRWVATVSKEFLEGISFPAKPPPLENQVMLVIKARLSSLDFFAIVVTRRSSNPHHFNH